MRKIISLLSIAILCSLIAKAQYVTIPDASVREHLKSRYPSCFNTADQMDTTCSLIVNEDSLTYYSSTYPSPDWDGLQYFKNLVYLKIVGSSGTNLVLPATVKELICQYNSFSYLPSLPPGLKILDCKGTPLVDLPLLPFSLEKLDVSRSRFSTLPALPPALKWLNVDECLDLTSLPPVSGTQLERLYMSNSGLTSLPMLPNTLRILDCNLALRLDSLPALPPFLDTLDCSRCFNLTWLPNLPSALTYLDCTATRVVRIPDLPESLLSLYCGDPNFQVHSADNPPLLLPPLLPSHLKMLDVTARNITVLPPLPNTLKMLRCAANKLLFLPSLPDSLISIICDHNLLTALPALPSSLRYMDCSYNNIYCIPVLPTITNMSLSPQPSIYIDEDKINCLPNRSGHIIRSRSNSPMNLPLCNPVNNRNQCPAFPVIQGSAFYDANNNGIKDANEPIRKEFRVTLSNGASGFTNNNGIYEVGADSIGNYTLTAEAPRYYTCSPSSYNFNFTSYDTLVIKDFALRPIASIDELTVHITPINQAARPGFAFAYQISYENTGTTMLSPTIIFDYDETRLSYNASSLSGIVDDTHQLSFTVNALQPCESGAFISYFTLKPTVRLGDSIWARASIHANSFYAYDSTSSIIRGSFDPNDKQATPQLSPAQVANGDYIDYTIRFQNTGTDTAFNVVISDTLSSMLQANTLQMIAASHNCKTTVKNNIVFFEFLNIQLPDSNVNEAKSHGFVSFKIKPQNNVSVNSTINNKAAIYFDYNAPVITNTASTLIKEFITVPLKLVSFSAVPQTDRTTTLYWNTANEINSNYFVIESGTDGLRFNSITTITAKGMANNSYTSTVADNNIAIVFYRLKMVDKDGRFTYSPIIKIDRRKNTPGFTILSNPVKDMLVISTAGSSLNNTAANIINSQGGVVKSFTLVQGSQTIDIKNLPAGIYYLRTVNGSGKIVIR